MTVSDSNPIQFWPTGTESYNEKAICGVYTECFCQPLNADDPIRLQFYDGVPGASYLLRFYDTDDNLLLTDTLNEVDDGVFESTFEQAIAYKSTAYEAVASSSQSWTGIAYGGGSFVAVASAGTKRAMYSYSKGKTWTLATTESPQWNDVAYGNDVFVAVASSSSNRVMVSDDLGETWTPVLVDASSWSKIIFDGTKFVAIAISGTTRMITSTDGLSWSSVTLPITKTWFAIASNGTGTIVVLAASGTDCVYSLDGGTTWTATTQPAKSWNDIAYGEGLFVAVGDGGGVATSSDGITWTSRNAAEGADWDSVAYGNGVFIAVASAGVNRAMISTDGIAWYSLSISSVQWRSIIFGEGVFVAVNFDSSSQVSILKIPEIQAKVYGIHTIQDYDSWTNTGSGEDWIKPGLLWYSSITPAQTTKYLTISFESFIGENYLFTLTWGKSTASSFGTMTIHIALADSSNNILDQHDFVTGSVGDSIYDHLFTLSSPIYNGTRILIWTDGAADNPTLPQIESLTISSDSEEIELLHSDCISVKDLHDCTELITYDNTVNFDGLVFETSGSPSGGPFYLRVPAQFWKENNPQTQEDHELSNGEVVTLRQTIQEKKLLELGYMPNYMHKKLQKILMMDSILIDGEYWKKRDEYESENINRYGLKRAKVWLTKYDSVKKNTP